jgi:sec-independent protein translocase protein TatB
MFDFSFGELAIIGVVALVVLGPEKLPKVARTAGHLLGRARAYANQVKSDIDREVQMDELRKLQQEAQAAARSFETAVNDVGRSVESEAGAAQQAFNQINSDFDAKQSGNQDALSQYASNASPQSTPPGSSAVADEIAALESSIAEQAAAQSGAQNAAPVADAATSSRVSKEDIR